MSESLYVYYEDREVGTLRPDDRGRLSFVYADTWLAGDKPGFPVSKSMPLSSVVYTSVAHAYFTNLLPEGGLRELICNRLKISLENDYELLKRIGGDCAGALRILKEDDDIGLDEQGYEPIIDLTSAERITDKALLQHPDRRTGPSCAWSLRVYAQ